MGYGSARFFEFLQDARFYRRLLRDAVALVPPREGATWTDVGCGPGLVARLAAERGFRASGFDLDPWMVALARRRARAAALNIRYAVCPLDALAAGEHEAAVVSAASLLAVVPDRRLATAKLLSCLSAGGILLVVETSEAMTPVAAWAWLRREGFGRRNWLLLIWALSRRKGRAIVAADLASPGVRVDRHDLLDGMVAAWIVSAEIGAGQNRSVRTTSS